MTVEDLHHTVPLQPTAVSPPPPGGPGHDLYVCAMWCEQCWTLWIVVPILNGQHWAMSSWNLLPRAGTETLPSSSAAQRSTTRSSVHWYLLTLSCISLSWHRTFLIPVDALCVGAHWHTFTLSIFIHSSQWFSPADRLDLPPISTSMAALDLLDTQVCSVARTTHHQGLSLAHLSNSQEHVTQVTPHLMCPVFLFLGVTLIFWLSVQQWCEAFLYVSHAHHRLFYWGIGIWSWDNSIWCYSLPAYGGYSVS